MISTKKIVILKGMDTLSVGQLSKYFSLPSEKGLL